MIDLVLRVAGGDTGHGRSSAVGVFSSAVGVHTNRFIEKQKFHFQTVS